jgi:2-polyprenyl-3-methyl-5-hydroxy-6-metoxy-1,4-benzoquinol methylase
MISKIVFRNKHFHMGYRKIYEKYYSNNFRFFHDTEDNKENEQFYYFWKNNLLKYIKGYPKDNSRILDLGCGIGQHMYSLERLGFKNIEGVDLSDENVEILLKKGYAAKKGEAIDFLKRCEEKYDIILIWDMLEHLKKDEIAEILSLIKGNLKEGGLLINVTPNGQNPFSLPSRYIDITHEIIFTQNSLRAMLGMSGFQNNNFLFFNSIDFFVYDPNIFLRLFRLLFSKIIGNIVGLVCWFVMIPQFGLRNIKEYKSVLFSISENGE